MKNKTANVVWTVKDGVLLLALAAWFLVGGLLRSWMAERFHVIPLMMKILIYLYKMNVDKFKTIDITS